MQSFHTTLSSSNPSGMGPFWNFTLTELTQCLSFVGVIRSPSNWQYFFSGDGGDGGGVRVGSGGGGCPILLDPPEFRAIR